MEQDKRLNEHGIRSTSILLVENDHGHAHLIEKNLRRAGFLNLIFHCDDGQKAVDFLLKERNDQVEGPLRFVVLLDLFLPVLDGYQVLKIIKNNKATKCIPVIVLTIDDNPDEVSRCYDLGCNLHITKPIGQITTPVEFEHFSTKIQVLGNFLSIVKTPGRV
jgi:CheY-like chemotaxis protein